MRAHLSARARHDRGRSRAWFLQVHYRWETQGEATSLDAALEDTLARRVVSAARVAYLERLVREFAANRARIDDRIGDATDNWRMDRLSVMDRGILRLGATELLCMRDVPGKVAVQESVRLADRYGGPESPRFVNGVLDAVYRSERLRGIGGRERPPRGRRGRSAAGTAAEP